MLKKLYALLPRVKDTNLEQEASRLSVEIAKAQRIGDPYAHHWYRQPNNTLCCNKCGEINLNTKVIGRETKCTVHTDHPSN